MNIYLAIPHAPYESPLLRPGCLESQVYCVQPDKAWNSLRSWTEAFKEPPFNSWAGFWWCHISIYQSIRAEILWCLSSIRYLEIWRLINSGLTCAEKRGIPRLEGWFNKASRVRRHVIYKWQSTNGQRVSQISCLETSLLFCFWVGCKIKFSLLEMMFIKIIVVT